MIQPESVQALLARLLGGVEALFGGAQLGGDEQLLAGMPDAAIARPTASSFP